MGNTSSDVFPQPATVESVSSVPPNWALAIILSAVAVTLLWIIAIIILILFEVLGKGRDCSSPVAENVNTLSSTPSLHGHPDTISLGTPPPPIRSPIRRPHGASRATCVGEATPGGDSHNVAVPLSHPLHEEEKEFKLTLVDEPSDIMSRSSSNASSIISIDSSVASNQSQEKDKKPSVIGASVDGASVDGATNLASLESNDGYLSPLSGLVLSRPVTVRQLGATIREPGYVETEFRKLPFLSVSIDSLPPGTERKNRYTNILPTPRTRVVLPEVFGYSNSDYINANFIRGYRNAVKQYIATQGPLENTVEDFWRMIIDTNTSVIVMATNFQESGIDKCTRYWPAQGSEGYGSIQVTLIKQTANGTHNTSTLQVQTSGGVTKTVVHYRLTCWPLQGVPKDTKVITDFLKNIKMADSSGPAVVHCSAGIGRTGVLIACDIGVQGILQGDPRIDVLRIVSTLRQDRNGMVQTRDQYRFIHQALYNFAREEGTK